MESESGKTTKISDSGYSANSCSNTTSQRSASSNSRLSGGSNSSGSSGYDGGASKENESDVQQVCKRINKDHKKQKNQRLFLSHNLVKIPQDFCTPFDFVPPLQNSGLENDKSSSQIDLKTSTNEDILEIMEKGAEIPSSINLDDDNVQEFVQMEESDEANPTVSNKNNKSEILGDDNNNKHETEFNNNEVAASDIVLSSSNEPKLNGEFCCVVSLYDGVVLYTTPSITSVLGFPKDSWLGQSFIDFVHPKDRKTFSAYISANMTKLPLTNFPKDVRNDLYICLRKSSSISSYQAFHLTITMKEISNSAEMAEYQNNGIILVIIAVPIYSSYKIPGERKKSTKFGMRHTASCLFSYVDPEVVTSFGFLPQDMLGKSVFDFYHPEDMPFLKEVYLSVAKTCQLNGSVFRSKPYRFLVQNGCFAMIETEWSSIKNPWSRELELVITLHQVLQGPLNPNVFDVTISNGELSKIPTEVIKQGKILQAEIIQILTEPLPALIQKSGMLSKRCKDVANFMESLIINNTAKVDKQPEYNTSVSERDFIMLGEISPHHDFSDSKSSSETPPSYNQLNYNENINRFFKSNPKTSESNNAEDENNFIINNNDAMMMDTDEKDAANNQKYLLSSDCGSAKNLSSGSNQNKSSGTNTLSNNEDYKPLQLTESALVRHNEDMEKFMLQKHKNERSHNKKHAKEVLNNTNIQGIKRTGCCLSWRNKELEEVQRKITKRLQNENELKQEKCGTNAEKKFPKENNNDSNIPFSITPQHVSMPEGNSTNNYIPICYFPTFVQNNTTTTTTGTSQQNYQVQYNMPADFLYNNSILPQQPSILCFPLPIFSVPLEIPKKNDQQNFSSSIIAQNINNNKTEAEAEKTVPATSRKAEPGSRIGSIASASLINNKVLYEYSHNKDLGFPTRSCSPFDTSLICCPPESEIETEQKNAYTKIVEASKNVPLPAKLNNRMDEESSCYSSSYSSFFKTDSISIDDSSSSNNNNNRIDDNKRADERDRIYAMRKKDPAWIETVSVSQDLIYRYQMDVVNDIDEILKKDLKILQKIEQPVMVNDQLQQLYLEMELEGLSKALTLEENSSSSSSTSSSSDEDEENLSRNFPTDKFSMKKRRISYNSLMIFCEENAPFPPPDANYS